MNDSKLFCLQRSKILYSPTHGEPGHDVHRCDTQGDEGRFIFLNLSRTYPGYGPSECDIKKKYNNHLKTARGGVTCKNLLHPAKQTGVKLPTRLQPPHRIRGDKVVKATKAKRPPMAQNRENNKKWLFYRK